MVSEEVIDDGPTPNLVEAMTHDKLFQHHGTGELGHQLVDWLSELPTVIGGTERLAKRFDQTGHVPVGRTGQRRRTPSVFEAGSKQGPGRPPIEAPNDLGHGPVEIGGQITRARQRSGLSRGLLEQDLDEGDWLRPVPVDGGPGNTRLPVESSGGQRSPTLFEEQLHRRGQDLGQRVVVGTRWTTNRSA